MLKKWMPMLCTATLTVIMAINGGLAYAGNYTVDWWHMQKRTYENGDAFNQLGFGVTDEFGNIVKTNVVSSIVLVGPGGMNALPPTFSGVEETLAGRFNENSGQWEVDLSRIKKERPAKVVVIPMQ